jgi:hypothetical protein
MKLSDIVEDNGPRDLRISSVFDKIWAKAYEGSPTWSPIWKRCHDVNGEWPKDFQIRGQRHLFLLKNGKLCVPEDLALQLLHDWHCGPLGHAGVAKMEQVIKKKFEIVDLHNLLAKLKGGCQICQASDNPSWSIPGEWISTPIPPVFMDSIAMEICYMPPTKNWDGQDVDAIFVIVDRLSGWICAQPILNKGFTSKKAARLVHHVWMDIFGVPSTILTDLGPQFVSSWFKNFCALQGVQHATSIAYRHNTNGRAEQAIEQILVKLRKLHEDEGLDWTLALPRAIRQLHDLPGPSGLSPFQVVFGRDRLDQFLPLPRDKDCEDALQWHAKMVEMDVMVAAKVNELHQKRQEAQKKHGGRPVFGIGDLVWVQRPPAIGGDKVDSRWTGPCKIMQR